MLKGGWFGLMQRIRVPLAANVPVEKMMAPIGARIVP